MLTGEELLDKEVQQMLLENAKRLERLEAKYDPITGEKADIRHPVTNENIYCRRKIEIPDHAIPVQWLPYETQKNLLYKAVIKYGSIGEYIRQELEEDPEDEDIVQFVQRSLIEVRYRTDPLFWFFMEWRIKDKRGQTENLYLKTKEQEIEDDEDGDIEINKSDEDSSLIPFKLNCAQLQLLAVLERQRLKGQPIRVILAKCRQWGGSTLTEAYMAWIQLMLKNSWYSVIVAQVSSTAKKIQMMYEKAIGQYSPWLLKLPAGERLRFSQFGRSATDFRITYGSASSPKNARDAVISVGTYENPDSLPGTDIAMAHFSELGLWKRTEGKTPEDVFKSVAGGIANLPLTMIVSESTPRGSGNFFAEEYHRAKNGDSAYEAVFISPAYNPYDVVDVKNRKGFARWIIENKNRRENPDEIFGHKGKRCRVSGEYIWKMWTLGSSLENIMWYLLKHLELSRHSDMASEAPIDDIEAFSNTDALAFDMYDIEEMEQRDVKDPMKVGDIYSDYTLKAEVLNNYKFEEKASGTMKVWEEPNPTLMTDQYIVVVDIGGKWKKADWSVIRVLDRSDLATGGMEKTALMWHGHIPHDHLAWKAVQVAMWYNNALLVFESNTLETKDKNRDVEEGDQMEYILETINRSYRNLFMRRSKGADDVKQTGGTWKFGFHTNRETKPQIVDHIDDAIRNKNYIEHDAGTIAEFKTYERNDGVYEAMAGCKDDRLMTAGIGLLISRSPKYGLRIPKIKRKFSNGQKEKNGYNYRNTHAEASI
jgi:hypothetical protein